MQELTTFISNHPGLSTALAIAILLLLILESFRGKGKSHQVDTAEAIKLINRDHAIIIDTRAKEDFKQGHIIDAHSIPANELNDNRKKLEKFKTKPIIFVCQAGVQSQKLAASLQKEGYNAYALAGGMRSWKDAQMPVVKE